MAEYPNIKPNFYSPLILIDYAQYDKTWDTGVYSAKRTQFNGIGLRLTLKYQKKCKEDKDTILNFYHDRKRVKGFTLPLDFYTVLNPANFKLTIDSHNFYKWKFAERISVRPFIWNKERSLYDFDVVLESAMV